MYQEISLKREAFANAIRLQQRQKKKKQLRDKILSLRYEEKQKDTYDDSLFRGLRSQVRESNYNRERIDQALKYLFSKNIQKSLTNELNLKLIYDITQKFHKETNDHLYEWQEDICMHIRDKLQQVLRYQVSKSPRDEGNNIIPTNQLSQLSILKYCFDGIFRLMQNFTIYHQLWHTFSHIRNKQLKAIGFESFLNSVQKRIQNLSSDQISVIVFSLDNFIQDCPQCIDKIIGIIDIILSKYRLKIQDTIKLIDCLLFLMDGKFLKQHIQIILQSTNLYENITQYADKSNPKIQKHTNCQLMSKVAHFIAKMFAIDDDELCNKVYMQNIMILSYLRSWLPINGLVSIQMMENFSNNNFHSIQLAHNNNKTNLYIIYALCNIAASDYQFLQNIVIKTDIYRTIVILYKYMPVRVREQISAFIYILVAKSDVGALRVMLQSKLPDLLGQMLKQSSSFILLKSTATIRRICQLLNDQIGNMSQLYTYLYTIHRFKSVMESIGAMKNLESLMTSPEDNISNNVVRALEMFKE